MTGVEQATDSPVVGSSRLRELAREDVSARAVAEALRPGDRERFLAEYDRLAVEARASLEVQPLIDLVHRWRGLAALQLDPQRYLRHLQRTIELVTGVPARGDETIEQLREKIGA